MPHTHKLDIEHHIKEVIEALGENSQRAGLLKTPERAAKALCFLTEGYKKQKEVIEDCKNAIFPENVHSVIAVKNIEFYSLCEHHLLPFWGSVSISFLPNKSGKILGLSKFGRLVDVYARRLQVQERFTQELAETIVTILKPQGICVQTKATHMCMMMRGVEKHQSHTSAYYYAGSKKLEQKIKEELR